MFDDFRDEAGLMPVLTIGRDPNCQIPTGDETSVSVVHAMLERQSGGKMTIKDSGSTNGVLVDGERIEEPMALRVGMRIDIGRVRLVAIDHNRQVPLLVSSIGELCQRSFEIWGSYSEAARHLDAEREYVRTHAQKWKEEQLWGE